MQHKRRKSGGKWVLVALAILVIGGLIVLMTADVPAQRTLTEQALDAKTFLESKPAE
jgi:hypothetical protein